METTALGLVDNGGLLVASFYFFVIHCPFFYTCQSVKSFWHFKYYQFVVSCHLAFVNSFQVLEIHMPLRLMKAYFKRHPISVINIKSFCDININCKRQRLWWQTKTACFCDCTGHLARAIIKGATLLPCHPTGEYVFANCVWGPQS